MPARAWLAIALSYLLGLNAFVLAATPVQPDRLGVICSQDRSAPNQQKRQHKGHHCCTPARCGAGAFLLGPPPDAIDLATRIASSAGDGALRLDDFFASAPFFSFQARGPPQPV